MGKINVVGLDAPVEIAGDEPTPEEATKIREHLHSFQGKKLEHPDLPTTAAIPISEALKYKDGVSWDALKDIVSKQGSAAALSLGVLSTTDPRARQEMYIKHIPGAKAVDDVYGNPMVEWNGKRYYTSGQKGTVDALDIGRTGLGVVGALPAIALAPASVPGAIAAAGAFGAGQSVAEDVATIAAGGEHNISGEKTKIDTNKALVSGALGAGTTALGAAIVPAARALYGASVGPMFETTYMATANGMRPVTTATARGSKILEKAGMTPEQIANLTPEIRDEITKMTNANFGSSKAAEVGYQKGLGREFGVSQTEGELTGDTTQIGREKILREGGEGPVPAGTMKGQVADRQQGLNAAQEQFRGEVGGGQPMTAQQAGDILAGQHSRANAAARQRVSDLYTSAADEAQVVAAGGQRRARMSDFQGLGERAASALDANNGPGREIINADVASLAPNTRAMIEKIQQLEAGGSSGNARLTGLNWDAFDKIRRQLMVSRTAANDAGKATDINGTRRVLQAFDEHFMGQNPLLTQARAAHAERMTTFAPQTGAQTSQTPLTQTMLKVLGKNPDAVPGAEVVNKLFGGKLAGGEATQAFQHLLEIHPPGSAGHQAMAEQALARLFTNKTGQIAMHEAGGVEAGSVLSPQMISNNINKALGEKQNNVYRMLLSDEQIAKLQRFADLNERIASAARAKNPSGSGMAAIEFMHKHGAAGIGGSIGGWIGNILGGPAVGAAGIGVGGYAGKLIANAASKAAAVRAINPGAAVGNINTTAAPYMAGILGPSAVRGASNADIQPIDALKQGLLGL